MKKIQKNLQWLDFLVSLELYTSSKSKILFYSYVEKKKKGLDLICFTFRKYTKTWR